MNHFHKNPQYCPLCHTQELSVFGSVQAIKYSKGQQFDLTTCRHCQVVFLNPFPSNVQEYYPKTYNPHNKNIVDKLNKSTFDHKLTKFIFMHSDPLTKHMYYFKVMLAQMYNYTSYRLIPFNLKTGKALDIGCGMGYYLSILKNIRWDCHGIEINKEIASCAADALAIDIKCTDLEHAKYLPCHFDLITMWHSLEHFENPNEVLKQIHKNLKKDGLLIIGVPNHDSWDRFIFKESWNGYELPLHLFHFNLPAIKLLLFQNDFKIIHIVFPIQPSGVVKSVRYYLRYFVHTDSFHIINKVIYVLALPYCVLASIFKATSTINIVAKKIS